MPRAFRDLDSIFAYLAYEKLEPENARNQVGRIRDSILGLDSFPGAHQDRLVGRYAGKGYKQLPVDQYLVIYRIDEEKKIVYVVTVQYQGRNC
jgi:toxin ParE1/3/4